MSDQIYERELLVKLESYIEDFDKIFLIPYRGKLLEECILSLNDSKAIKNAKRKILLLTTEKNRWELNKRITYYQIEEAEIKFLYKMYYMYEFSDRFQVIYEPENYGSLFNFVNIGILCREEIWESLLY